MPASGRSDRPALGLRSLPLLGGSPWRLAKCQTKPSTVGSRSGAQSGCGRSDEEATVVLERVRDETTASSGRTAAEAELPAPAVHDDRNERPPVTRPPLTRPPITDKEEQ